MSQGQAEGTPACGHCGAAHTVRNGSVKGRKRWLCRGCGRSFGVTTGTPLAGLRTEVAEVAYALLIVRRRGSLRAAEDLTRHKYETSGRWLRRAGAHAEALTAVLVSDLHLTEVEVDEFWSFVRTKGGALRPARPPATVPLAGNGGGVTPSTARRAS